MRKIKVLYIVDKMEIGGTQRHILEVLRLTNRDLFEPHLCCLVRIGELEEELARLGSRPKVFSIKRIYGFSGIMGIIALRNYIKEEGFDVVHTYLFLANLAGNIAARLAGVPVIISGRRDTGVPCEGKWYHNLAYAVAHRFASKVICVSNAVAGVVRSKERVGEDKIVVIQNGSDLPETTQSVIKRQDLGLKEDDFIVNMTASFSWVKNHKFLLNAAPLIIQKNSKVKFLLVGDGELRPDLELTVKKQRLSDNIIFFGPRKDAQDLMKISDAGLSLSYSEGSSNTILEAMSLGKPVIASNVAGNRELIVDGKTGFLVGLGDAKGLAEKILLLASDKKLCLAMGNSAQEHVRKNFSLQEKIQQLETVYCRLLNINRASGQAKKKLKILFLLTDSLKFGGAQINIVSLCRYLGERGHEVILACRRGELVEKPGLGNFTYIDFDFHFKGILRLARCIKNMKELIKSYQPDIIAPQSIRTAIITKKAIKRTGKPIIISTVYNVGSKFYSLIAPYFLNKASDYIIFESNYERNKLVSRGLDSKKSKVIHTGIDLREFSISGKNKEMLSRFGIDGELIIGTVARLSPEKDIPTLIEAFNILSKDISGIKLIIVGDGPLRKDYKTLVKQLNLEDKVIFVGMQEKTKKYLSMFDIFVLSSKRESFSLAAREAMAMGKPLVLTNVGGSSEMLQNKKEGLLVPSGNPKALASAIKQLIDSAELREAMGQQAKVTAEQRFDKNEWLRRTEEIYLSAVN